MPVSPIGSTPNNSGRVQVNLNLAASSKTDAKNVYYLAQRLGSSNYNRYGSTMEFYIPTDHFDDFKLNFNGKGLDFYI